MKTIFTGSISKNNISNNDVPLTELKPLNFKTNSMSHLTQVYDSNNIKPWVCRSSEGSETLAQATSSAKRTWRHDESHYASTKNNSNTWSATSTPCQWYLSHISL